MADYNLEININIPIIFEIGNENFQYQFRAEYGEDNSTVLIYRKFSTFSERNIALSLISSLALACKQVFMPPCNWLFHGTKSSFYQKGSFHAKREVDLAEKAIAPWLKGRTVFVIPAAFILTAIGLAAAVASLFVSVQEDTYLFKLAAKIDRLVSGISDETLVEMSTKDRFKNVSYIAPEIQPVAAAIVNTEADSYEEGVIHIDQRDLKDWFDMNKEVVAKGLDNETFEGFLNRVKG